MIAADRERVIVLYDDDCGFCRWAVGLLLRWDRRHRLWPSPIQGVHGDRWLAAMPEAERLAAWHLVAPGGSLTSAGRALPEALSLLPGGTLPAATLRAAGPVVRWAYRFVAEHRRWFSRPLRRSWVDAATARMREREREPPPGWAGGMP